ncbi:hypothetical protein GCM10008955_38280 [Deinococcus malanensis]|uniref:Uncharacterized protein n=1 Tax=Deinococcus malanensis TaxID=1706855 RepID=A0ABQ2F4S6_9DEIO|nr:hypothetical protein [Deinococcus malanensis]GGK40857.1 hypothetical protein GCM10008955_38280 [Deinococcus malanensis]
MTQNTDGDGAALQPDREAINVEQGPACDGAADGCHQREASATALTEVTVEGASGLTSVS